AAALITPTAPNASGTAIKMTEGMAVRRAAAAKGFAASKHCWHTCDACRGKIDGPVSAQAKDIIRVKKAVGRIKILALRHRAERRGVRAKAGPAWRIRLGPKIPTAVSALIAKVTHMTGAAIMVGRPCSVKS